MTRLLFIESFGSALRRIWIYFWCRRIIACASCAVQDWGVEGTRYEKWPFVVVCIRM